MVAVNTASSSTPTWFVYIVLVLLIATTGVWGNQPPVFTQDMNNLILSENTPVGTEVHQLKGSDPENSPVHYGLVGTDRLQVDRETGQVTLVQPLDREVNDTLRLLVTLEDEVENSEKSTTVNANNLVQVPISVIIIDENDNAPVFKNAPYEVSVMEDTPVGSTIFSDIIVDDADLSGNILEVTCMEHPQFPKTCDHKFSIVSWNSSQYHYLGGLVLQGSLDYNERQFYQMLLVASDGEHNSTTSVQVKVGEVQDTAPVFLGSLTGVILEDDPIGTLVMTVQARDGDRGHPRNIYYELVTNPLDYFLLDSVKGELRTAKPLDREALLNSTGVISLAIKAREIVDGVPGNDLLTATTAIASVTIKDVNDEPPRFNHREYSVSLPENILNGTKLPNLDMIVTDTDVAVLTCCTLLTSQFQEGPAPRQFSNGGPHPLPTPTTPASPGSSVPAVLLLHLWISSVVLLYSLSSARSLK